MNNYALYTTSVAGVGRPLILPRVRPGCVCWHGRILMLQYMVLGATGYIVHLHVQLAVPAVYPTCVHTVLYHGTYKHRDTHTTNIPQDPTVLHSIVHT